MPRPGSLRRSYSDPFPTAEFEEQHSQQLARELERILTTSSKVESSPAAPAAADQEGDELELEAGPGPTARGFDTSQVTPTVVRERAQGKGNMENGLLNPRLAGTRARQIQDARNMQEVVAERLTKKGLNVPPYEFLELIGKGSYGRVYKRYEYYRRKELSYGLT